MVADGIAKILLEVEHAMLSVARSFEDVSEEDRCYRRAFERLGSFGWTVDWFAPPGLYRDIPDNLEEIDKRFKEYFTKERVDRIVRRIEEYTDSRNSREAIMCFRRGCYNASAGLLLSAIEKEVIQYRHKPEDKNRVFGKLAISRFKDKTSMMFTQGSIREAAFLGMIESLRTIWGDTVNFADTPIINRNNVLHGMMQRNITRLDCIKLLLLYHNVLRYVSLTT